MTRSTLPFLYAAAVVLLVVGLSARVWAAWLLTPDAVSRQDTSSFSTAAEPLVSLQPGKEGLAAIVVSTNLFSSRRSAAGARFADSAPAPRRVALAPPPRSIRLFGIGTSGGQGTALLDADPQVPGAEIYRAGDALPGGGRVVRIAPDHVVIDTPEGRQHLRLPSTQPLRPPATNTPEGL